MTNVREKNGMGGYITLLSVIVLGAVGLSIALSLLLTGLGSSRSALLAGHYASARALSEACVEEALEEIREDTGYTSSETISFTAGECSYTIESGSGESRTVSAVGTVGSVVRRVVVEMSAIEPEILIEAWEDVEE